MAATPRWLERMVTELKRDLRWVESELAILVARHIHLPVRCAPEEPHG